MGSRHECKLTSQAKLPRCDGTNLIVIHDRVQGLDPHGVDVSIEDDPLGPLMRDVGQVTHRGREEPCPQRDVWVIAVRSLGGTHCTGASPAHAALPLLPIAPAKSPKERPSRCCHRSQRCSRRCISGGVCAPTAHLLAVRARCHPGTARASLGVSPSFHSRVAG